MRYLFDTDALSLARRSDRHPTYAGFIEMLPAGSAAISVMSVGEIRNGIERARRGGDRTKVRSLETWLDRLLLGFPVLPISTAVASRWGRIGVPDPVPVVDGLIAATAMEHGLTVVTRNVADFTRCGVDVVNPIE